MHYLAELSDFLARCRFEDIPAATVERARLLTADTLAVIASGAAEPEVLGMVDRIAKTPGEALVIGTRQRTEAGKAALLNGLAGTFLELDEGNQFARGHPGIHVFPAALAICEQRRLSGRDFLTALVLGYEVGTRIGIASKMRMSMHPHGTWGTVGAAVAVGKLAGYDASKMAEIINVSSTLGLGTSRQTMLQGGTVRNSFAGLSNQLGILAWDMVESGIVGEADGLTSVWGSVLSESFNPAEMTRELGSRWEIARNYFKRHACCRFNHGALDALDRLLDAQGRRLPVEDIDRVVVRTYALAAELDSPTPRNTLAGKFSVPFAIATTLMRGASGVASFRLDAIHDAKTRALAAKVSIVSDDEMTAAPPGRRPAEVTIHLKDGRKLVGATETNRGDFDDPYSTDELTAKFHELGDPVWGRAGTTTLHKACLAIDQEKDMRAFTGKVEQLTLAAAAA